MQRKQHKGKGDRSGKRWGCVWLNMIRTYTEFRKNERIFNYKRWWRKEHVRLSSSSLAYRAHIHTLKDTHKTHTQSHSGRTAGASVLATINTVWKGLEQHGSNSYKDNQRRWSQIFPHSLQVIAFSPLMRPCPPNLYYWYSIKMKHSLEHCPILSSFPTIRPKPKKDLYQSLN